MVAWILSPPMKPLEPDEVVEMVCSLYPRATCSLIVACRLVRLEAPRACSEQFFPSIQPVRRHTYPLVFPVRQLRLHQIQIRPFCPPDFVVIISVG